MSTLYSQADVHRIISREEEPYSRPICVVAAPRVDSDIAYLDHVGAHFPPGSRKGSLPAYPEGVEVSEDEASSAQPDTATFRAKSPPRVRLNRGAEPLSYSATMPERHIRHDHPNPSSEDFVGFQLQRPGRHRHEHDSSELAASLILIVQCQVNAYYLLAAVRICCKPVSIPKHVDCDVSQLTSRSVRLLLV
jgi:hypothetical protein